MKNWHKFLILLCNFIGFELFSSDTSSDWCQRSILTPSTFSALSNPLLYNENTKDLAAAVQNAQNYQNKIVSQTSMTYQEADLAIITIKQHRNLIQEHILVLDQDESGMNRNQLKFKKNNEDFDKKIRKNLYAKCFCCCMSVNWRISQDAYHELDQHITMGKSVYQQCTGRKFPKNL